MTEAEIIERLTEALTVAAEDAAPGAELVSINASMFGRANDLTVVAKTERKTRSLIFLSAEGLNEAGVRVAAAASVHKIST